VKVSLATRLVVASALLALVVAAAVLSLSHSTTALDDATRQRSGARLGLAAVAQVEKDVLDLETGVRGFIITRDERFLQPWHAARHRLPADLALLRRRLQSRRGSRTLALSLARDSVSYLRDYTRPLVAAARAGASERSSATTTAAGKARADRIRRIADRLRGALNAEATRLSASADDEAHDASRLGIAALLASSLLIVLFTAYLLGKVVAPIRTVGAAADDLAAGDLSARAPVDSIPEISQLGGSFNRMAETIADSRAEMDARNIELSTAKREAERANQAKSEFLSRMSHELRTPLNAVLGFAQLLELDELTDDQRESVQLIARAGGHLLQLIDEVLDIARVETGQLRLSPEPIEAGELIQETLELVGPLVEQRSIRLVTDFADCVHEHVLADRQRLKQILLNLLSNAIKYNREAGEVRVSLQPAAREQLVISVADTGAGLSPEQLSKLFEPFERLGAERGNVDGTGLGLALSRRLAEAMHGTIDVHSEPGKGSTFSVRFPRMPPPEPVDEPIRDVAQQSIPGAPKILYIEDNLSNQRLVERVLARQSRVTFLPAMQGTIGLELAREHAPDLVLLDLHLPDLHGDEVLVRLKAEPATRDTPVVMLSADASPGQIRRLREAGAAAYLTKPIDLRELLEVVARHLRAPGSDGA
jgi:signal transduction histidine kinase/ActR/RegA family two-component response regulator